MTAKHIYDLLQWIAEKDKGEAVELAFELFFLSARCGWDTAGVRYWIADCILGTDRGSRL